MCRIAWKTERHRATGTHTGYEERYLYDITLLTLPVLQRETLSVGVRSIWKWVLLRSGRTAYCIFPDISLQNSSTGAQLLQSNTLQDSLHPILKSMKHVQGRFNIFRRYRLSYIDKSDCPEALRHFWSGHAPRHVSERYTKLMNDRQYRLDWAERLGTGFQIPGSARQTRT